MAADGENILCILCERNIENGGGTELSHRDHPLFPGSLGTLRDLMMNSICAYYAYSATPLDSASLEFIVSPDSKICDDCLEKMATCIHLQQRSESAAAMMRFASRNGWSNLWPKVSLPLLSPLITWMVQWFFPVGLGFTWSHSKTFFHMQAFTKMSPWFLPLRLWIGWYLLPALLLTRMRTSFRQSTVINQNQLLPNVLSSTTHLSLEWLYLMDSFYCSSWWYFPGCSFEQWLAKIKDDACFFFFFNCFLTVHTPSNPTYAFFFISFLFSFSLRFCISPQLFRPFFPKWCLDSWKDIYWHWRS